MPTINTDCNIFDKLIADDLLNYALEEKEGSLRITYSNGVTFPINIKLDILSRLKNQSLPTNVTNNIWYPIFIDNDNFVNNKVLSTNGTQNNPNSSFLSGRIGIEDFITFQPQLNSWLVGNETATMSIDWILNQPTIPHYLIYGIMGWFKIPTRDNAPDSSHIPFNSATIDKFPIGSRLRTDKLSGITLIKVDNDTLYRLDRDNHSFDGNKWSHFTQGSYGTIKVKDLSDDVSDIQFYLAPDAVLESDTSIFGDNTQLWVADGDCFSYFESFQDKQMQHKANIMSQTYLSSCLYKHYTQIYNIITGHIPKQMTTGMPLIKLRAAKKIAMLLSTSPFITDFHIHNLSRSDISQLITNYIDKANEHNITNTISEINNIKELLIGISSMMSDDLHSISNKTINNNLIFSKKSLFKKLSNKYTPSLLMSSDTALNYRSPLTHGDNIYIQQTTQSLCDKKLAGSKKNLLPVYNNQKISLKNIEITTAISDNLSDINLTHGKTSTILPLAEVTKSFDYDANINIVMDYVTNVGPEFREDGQDFRLIRNTDPKAAIFQAAFGQNTYVSFSVLDFVDEDNSTNFMRNQFSFFWEQIEGDTKLYFSDDNITGDPKNVISRFETSTHSNPKVFISNPSGGRYSIQCTVVGPYGTLVKKKTFFVVNGIQGSLDKRSNTFIKNDTYGTYYIGDGPPPASRQETSENLIITPDINDPIIIQDSIPVNTRSNFLRVSSGILSEIAIERGGLLWAIQTNLVIKEKGANQYEYTQLSGSLSKFYFGSKEESQVKAGSPLSITYIVNNTNIKLLNIKLSNLRNESDPRCADCVSVYEPLLTSTSSIIAGSSPLQYRNVILRTGKSNDSVSLSRFEKIGGEIKEVESYNFYFPVISTKKAPPIKTYGGYSSQVIDQIGIDIPNLPKSNSDEFIDISAVEPEVIPPITGYNLFNIMDSPKPSNLRTPNSRFTGDEQDLKTCYQKSLHIPGHTIFNKGVFHPASGWIKHSTAEFEQHKNLSSVLKFNPGARHSYSFTGPGLYGIKAFYNRSTFESTPATFSSTINLKISNYILWEPLCGCESKADAVENFRITNQLNREYLDQPIGLANNLDHGYRYLAGGEPKSTEFRNNAGRSASTELVDEFDFTAEYIQSDNNNNNGVAYNYGFAVTGPNYPITAENIEKKLLRNPRVNNLTIQDLEIKLNFLNISNTKNVLIKFEGSHGYSGSTEACPLKPNLGSFVNSIFGDKIFADPNKTECDVFSNDAPNSDYIASGLIDYIDSLLLSHESNFSDFGITHSICLLNQEHLQNNKYNMILKFSDHASKYCVPYDHNIFTNTDYPILQQTVIKDGYSLPPSTVAKNYSDKDSVLYQNIIRNNQINLINNSFVKFKNQPLFINPNTPFGGCPGGTSRQQTSAFNYVSPFVLKIIVLEELDDMRSFDLVSNNDFINGYSTADAIQQSADIVNSLCSWELILHTDKARKYIAANGTGLTNYGNNDSLGLIEYGTDPKYPGYSFIADFTNKKYLIPKANTNAPYTYINDYAICDFSDEVNKPLTSRLRAPEWPGWAIVSILSSLFQGTTGSIVGTATGPGVGYNAGFSAIFEFLQNNRMYEAFTEAARNIYSARYDNFPFGSAEKVLLNVSKYGGIWYKLEAPIFRYDNSHILKHNTYKFIKISRQLMSMFSEFSFDKIYTISDIIEDSMIATLSSESLKTLQADPNIDVLNSLSEIQNLIDGSIIRVDNSNSIELDGIYIKLDNSLLLLESKEGDSGNWLHILKSKKMLFNQSLLSLFTQDPTNANSNLIKIKGKRAYHVFNIGENIEHYSNKDEPNTCKILGKAIIIYNNQYYTVFNLDKDISDSSFICHSNNDTIVVFKPQSTIYSDREDMPISTWSLEKQKIGAKAPEISKSTTGLGAYGDASLFKYKNYLTSNLSYNQLETLYELFNNHENDVLKYNNMTIVSEDKIIPINNIGAIGYACSLSDIKDVFANDNNYVLQNNIDTDLYNNIINQLNNTVGNIRDTKYEIIYIKSSELKKELEKNNIDYGDITFEQDFIQNLPVNNLNQEQIDMIVDRINFLNTNNDNIKSAIGNSNKTNVIIQSGGINDLIAHYGILDNDPVSCYQAINDSCHKTLTKQAIYNRTKERNELLELLDSQSIKTNNDSNITYQAKPSNEYLLPKTQITIEKQSDNSLSIKYSNNAHNYYWINIDPKQSCSLAEDATIKVLKKTVYKCTYANSVFTGNGIPLIPNNNICYNRPMGFKPGVNETVSSPSPGQVEYTISEAFINDKKKEYENNYPDIVAWKEYTIERRFTINNDDIITDSLTLPKQDIDVEAIETYDLAIPGFMNGDMSDLRNDGSADVNAVGGNDPNSQRPCDFTAISAGSGLLTLFGSRNSTPSRVYNVFNLDEQNELMVQFRKIPRQIRGVDYRTTVYRYGTRGSTFRPITSLLPPLELAVGQKLNNNFYYWHCLQGDTENNLIETSTPPFLNAQNEMIFRAFFGSTDNIESKDNLVSLFPWEMIPYEYDT